MSKEGKKSLVPGRRFPEFQGKAAWELKPLKEMANVIMGSSPSSEAFNTDATGLPFMQGNADIKKGLSAPRLFTSQITKECDVGDILLSVRAPVGTVAKSVHHACIGRGLAAIRVLSSNNQEFLYQWLLSFESGWHKLSQGGTFDAVNSDDVKELPIDVPSEPAEQQKIAECFTSVDELITAQTQKLDVLKIHKKGLMQQLFPAEGETMPKRRFSEFHDVGKWIEMTLGEITKFQSGGTPSKDKPEYWDGNIPWISASSMHNTCINSSDQKITQLAVDKGGTIAPKGTILLLVRGSMLHKRIPVGISHIDVAFNQDVKALDLKIDIHEIFLLYLLASSERRLLRTVSKTGIGAGKLDTNDLKDFLVCAPAKKEEQQKIADCLTSIDELITAQTKKIDALKAHKKGLMQQLFPTIDEVNE